MLFTFTCVKFKALKPNTALINTFSGFQGDILNVKYFYWFLLCLQTQQTLVIIGFSWHSTHFDVNGNIWIFQ